MQLHGLPSDKEDDSMKKCYEDPTVDIVAFETSDLVTASSDYYGIDFESLI